jgi:AbiV family abortive infection protein
MLTISKNEQAAMDALVTENPVLANAFRLMNDAALLFENGRYSSSPALAVLSLEEIGKYLLARWSREDPSFKYDKRRLLRMKLEAVADIFLTHSARREAKAAGIDFKHLKSPEASAEIARALLAGLEKARPFAEAILNSIIEAVKWGAPYYDEEKARLGIEPAKITAENASGLMQECRRAFMLLAIDGNIQIARVGFAYIHPQRWSVETAKCFPLATASQSAPASQPCFAYRAT